MAIPYFLFSVILDQAGGFLDYSDLSDLDRENSDDDGNDLRPFNDDGHLHTNDYQSPSEEEPSSLDTFDLSNFDSVFNDKRNNIPLSALRTNARLAPKTRSEKVCRALYNWKS